MNAPHIIRVTVEDQAKIRLAAEFAAAAACSIIGKHFVDVSPEFQDALTLQLKSLLISYVYL